MRQPWQPCPAPRLTEVFRNSQIKVSLEAGEPLLAETIDSLSHETKEKILFRNARELFAL